MVAAVIITAAAGHSTAARAMVAVAAHDRRCAAP